MSPEYVNQNKGPRILAVFWSLTCLTMLVVMARLFIRMRVLRSTGADDLLIGVSMVSVPICAMYFWFHRVTVLSISVFIFFR